MGPDTSCPLNGRDALEPVDPPSAGEVPHHRCVHQAAGMVTVQAEVGPAEAMSRLRAAAYATGRSLEDLAAAVVARDIWFDRRERG
ncbi:MAG TPA: ANTAR domain-containing protein [Actinomycetospora sp.]|jgi:hypothetical protein|uniref:ANTAR domain-containing protein n=1 Tax=Actinomycetospora sp. TaxID=1872135 RepID=UPI002F41CB0D